MPVPQERKLVTEIPGPASRELHDRTKNAVSATSIAAATSTAIQPHGAGSTVRARTIATIVSMDAA